MRCCGPGLGFLPASLVILSFGTFCTTYIIAIYRGDVSVLFPYISDTGTSRPESCIFGQFLNICAGLAFCTIYVRYKLVQGFNGSEGRRLKCMNKTCLFFGVLVSLGLSMVANFQETSVETVHIIGAAMVFGVGVLYEVIQTMLTYHMYPEYNGLYICRVRLTICILSFASMIISILFLSGSTIISRSVAKPQDKLHWKPDEAGYIPHIVSTAGEWATAVSFLLFFFTFIRDLQKVSLDINTRIHVRHLDEHPIYITDEEPVQIHSANGPDENTKLLS
ncbi:hypothetical protein ScPMuIL_015049 [Solemya velum]